MNFISSAIIQPLVIGTGASIFLFAYTSKLEIKDYFLHLPFWIGVVRPSGLYWQSKVLKQVNKGVFPAEMKVYREMYLASKNAIMYDVVLNHTFYHTFLATSLIAYMYLAKTFSDKIITKKIKPSEETAQKISETNSLGKIFKQSALTLLKGRVMISCLSIFSEYMISYLSLKKQGSSPNYSMPTNVKRFLMVKEMVLNWSWFGLILKEFFRNYQKNTAE